MWFSDDLAAIMKRYGWTQVRYDDARLREYSALLISEYGEGNDIAQDEYIRWQYYNNPAGKVNMYLAATPDDRVVGSYSFIPVRVLIGGTPKTAGISLNTLTHKDFRGRKIFTTLAEIAYQNGFRDNGISLIYGFPNPNSLPGFQKYLKFTEIGPIPLLIKVYRPGNVVKKRLGIPGAGLLNPIGKLFFRTRMVPKRMGEYQVKKIEKFTPGFLSLWERNKDLARILVVRDPEYLNWRYFENPVRRYEVFSVVDARAEVRGFIVCRVITKDGITSGLIGDILADRDDPSITDILIRKAEMHFHECSVDMCGALMFQHSPYYRDFRRNGFVKCPTRFEPQSFPVIVRSMENDESVLKKENWFLTMGDYDIF